MADPAVLATKVDLSEDEARAYVVFLINRDRAAEGLPPVLSVAGPALVAADRHAADMARVGFVGHYGSDGSVPEQRHSEAGGYDLLMENAYGYEVGHDIVQNARILRTELERAEHVFISEVPPHDGHRHNILGRHHTHVAVGLAMPRPGDAEIVPGPCLTQEFIDRVVVWDAPPDRIARGKGVHVAVTYRVGVVPGAIGVVRLAAQRPLAQAELNRRRAYPIPSAQIMYWGPTYVTPMPVHISGQRMEFDVPPAAFAAAGLYEISIWGQYPGEPAWQIVALHTLTVGP